MSFLAAKNWWMGAVIRSRWTGWGFFLAISVIAGLYWRFDNLSDRLAACEATPPQVTQEFAEQLKEQNREDKEERLADLEHAIANGQFPADCVYDPEQAHRTRALQDPDQGGE